WIPSSPSLLLPLHVAAGLCPLLHWFLVHTTSECGVDVIPLYDPQCALGVCPATATFPFPLWVVLRSQLLSVITTLVTPSQHTTSAFSVFDNRDPSRVPQRAGRTVTHRLRRAVCQHHMLHSKKTTSTTVPKRVPGVARWFCLCMGVWYTGGTTEQYSIN
ncbi:hypothetical protein EDB86DRAFT_3178209, partial [Lactarius hatsudake]